MEHIASQCTLPCTCTLHHDVLCNAHAHCVTMHFAMHMALCNAHGSLQCTWLFAMHIASRCTLQCICTLRDNALCHAHAHCITMYFAMHIALCNAHCTLQCTLHFAMHMALCNAHGTLQRTLHHKAIEQRS